LLKNHQYFLNTIELELLQNVREYLSPVFSNVDDERFFFHIAAACIDPVTYIMHVTLLPDENLFDDGEPCSGCCCARCSSTQRH
jgi:hypothetical protein